MTTPKAAGPACPLCAKPVAQDYRPFCSRRCADVDLQRWLSGAYVVPGGSDDDDARQPSAEDE
jgi:endogenous inhibitor of DNA gyrase (YacG/DUF329 family)